MFRIEPKRIYIDTAHTFTFEFEFQMTDESKNKLLSKSNKAFGNDVAFYPLDSRAKPATNRMIWHVGFMTNVNVCRLSRLWKHVSECYAKATATTSNTLHTSMYANKWRIQHNRLPFFGVLQRKIDKKKTTAASMF